MYPARGNPCFVHKHKHTLWSDNELPRNQQVLFTPFLRPAHTRTLSLSLSHICRLYMSTIYASKLLTAPSLLRGCTAPTPGVVVKTRPS